MFAANRFPPGVDQWSATRVGHRQLVGQLTLQIEIVVQVQGRTASTDHISCEAVGDPAGGRFWEFCAHNGSLAFGGRRPPNARLPLWAQNAQKRPPAGSPTASQLMWSVDAV